MTIFSKPIPCKDCQDETERIQSNGLFVVVDCKSEQNQENVPADKKVCTIRWQRKESNATFAAAPSVAAPRSDASPLLAAPLVRPVVQSIYEVHGDRVLLPERMARCTTDMKAAIYAIRDAVTEAKGKFALSDLFRSYDMQLQAHLDFKSGKKKAFSPQPGSSMHEAGRAFDVDLQSLKMALADFWEIAKRFGVVPIIDMPDSKKSEAWHFECRGSHQLVYDYYKAGNGTNFTPPAAMAASAIISVGLKHDLFLGKENAAYIQAGLVRLGESIGNIDGEIGPKTNAVLSRLGIAGSTTSDQVQQLNRLLQEKFPDEFFDKIAESADHLV